MALQYHQVMLVGQSKHKFYLTKLPAKKLVTISYASVRGVSDEEGAVQRILSPRRIASLKKFTVEGGDYPSCIILNWVNGEEPLEQKNSEIGVSDTPRSAQIIDGQHRIAGIREAIKENVEIGIIEIPVTIYENLATQECADIFLSINTSQKPVPKSLVYDLYGVASEQLVDPAIDRARDISISLNDEDDSPYYQQIKLPGSPRRKTGIQLSAVVNAIKPLVDEKGELEQIGIVELELQRQVLFNYFNVLNSKYGAKWESRDNVFLYAAGFSGAITFFRNRIVSYCNTRRSFSKETISSALSLSERNLIIHDEIKGLGGKDAPNVVFKRLLEYFIPEKPTEEEFEF